ncbi:MAG: GNAT family N-acetyltransferase [Rhodocyclaceae bacterium]|nr:GNAT family N-acetyltransferase [Rhodocyclaceae bacterium]
MPAEVRIVALCDEAGRIVEPGLVATAEAVHRQLRPMLPADYAGRIAAVCASGARLQAALLGDAVAGLALWRIVENTFEGRRLFVDDLVTDEALRGRGVGKALIGWLAETGRRAGCQVLALESGVQRSRAHAFYFREGLTIPSFSFRKKLV